MRPDWGGPAAIAGRIRFAEERLRLSLSAVCARAVLAAAMPATAPDAFIQHNPDRAPDAAQTQAHIAELRRQLAQQRSSPKLSTVEQTGVDSAAIAAEREWLVRAVAPLYDLERERRRDREEPLRAARLAFDGLSLEE
jgi:hypothetical protein